MPPSRSRRRKSYNEPGHAHELTFSCYQNYPFLRRNRTCEWLAEAIEHAREQHRFDLWAYVFMPDHVHLIVHPRDAGYEIATILRAIKAPVARRSIKYLAEHAPDWLPKITRRRGQREERVFWQSGGGFDRNIIEPKTLMEMIDYIHLNPVRKRLVERTVDWTWSSARAYVEAEGEAPMSVDAIPPEGME